MPAPIRKRKRETEKLKNYQRAFLYDDPSIEENEFLRLMTLYHMSFGRPAFKGDTPPEQLWRENKSGVVAHFQKNHPGARPEPGWRYEIAVDVPYESRLEYLKKNDLLTPNEIKVLKC